MIAGVVTGSAYTYHALTKQTDDSEDEDEQLNDFLNKHVHANYNAMTGEILPGRPGTLTPEQDLKLREFWIEVLKVFGVIDHDQARALRDRKSVV